MKRRTFLKRSSIGLSGLLVTSAGTGALLGGHNGKRRVYGIPDSVRPRTPLEHNLARLSLARTDLPPQTWQEIVALGLLAQDVFENPEVAGAFARNPRGYLKTIGLEEVVLDPEAIEVKVALALGDPEIRGAIEQEDAESFLQALERRGLLRSPEPSQLAARLATQLETLRATVEPGVLPEACTVVAVCAAVAWVWVAAVQDAVVAVAAAAFVSIYAIVMIYTRTVGPPKPKPESLLQLPPFRMATALGGREFGDKALQGFVEKNVERIAAAVENLEVFQESRPMDGRQLRDLVRQQMTRQLGGHAACADPARP